MDRDQIARIEKAAYASWPAESVKCVGGWWVRCTRGTTHRANSVWTCQDTGMLGVEEKVIRAEDIYRTHGLPAQFFICPITQPPDLDPILIQRGYDLEAPTLVQTAPLITIVAVSHGHPDMTVTVESEVHDDWIATYAEAERQAPDQLAVRTAIWKRIEAPTAYALVSIGHETAGTGLAVVDGDVMGIFSMATLPHWRRHRVATATLDALSNWGRSRGASYAYLQVTATNHAALGLYAGAGFRTLYEYHYRRQSATAPK